MDSTIGQVENLIKVSTTGICLALSSSKFPSNRCFHRFHQSDSQTKLDESIDQTAYESTDDRKSSTQTSSTDDDGTSNDAIFESRSNRTGDQTGSTNELCCEDLIDETKTGESNPANLTEDGESNPANLTKNDESDELLNNKADEASTAAAPDRRSKSTEHRIELSSIESFEEMNISSELLKGLESMDIKRPSNYQKQILPRLINHPTENVFIKSKPNSGKKIAYLTSALERIDPTLDAIQIIVIMASTDLVVYTTELAKQIAKYREDIKIGYAIRDSDDYLDCQLLISTAGSARYRMQTVKTFDETQVKLLIVDHLDLLIWSKSHLQNLRKLVILLRRTDCSYQAYSNCFDNNARNFVEELIPTDLVTFDLLNLDFSRFCQFYMKCNSPSHKYKSLLKVLKNITLDKVVLYVSSKDRAKRLFDQLKADGFNDVIVSTCKSHFEDNLNAIEQFNMKEKAILIINSPLQIGIDLKALSVVINYDLPLGKLGKTHLYLEYLHRISKCSNIGQPDKPNFVVNLIFDDERNQLYNLEKYYLFKIRRLA